MRSVSLKVGPPPDPILVDGCLFNEARLKLWWARIHTYNLSTGWEAFVQDYAANPQRFKQDSRDGTQTVISQVPIPPWVALATGDAIRNLRSTLDYLTSALARQASISDERTKFPFHEKRVNVQAMFAPESFKNGRKRKPGDLHDLGHAYPELANLILKEIQPWSLSDGASQTGDALWRLITTDNIDKHRLIVPQTQVSNVQSMSYSNPDGTNAFTMLGCIVVGDFQVPANLKADNYHSFTVNILFAQPARIAGKPVIASLVEGANIIAKIIDLFAVRFSKVAKA